MGRKKAGEADKINNIKEAAKSSGASFRLISLWLDVKYTTVSGWNSNTSQPNEENLNDIGELLEKDNKLLLASNKRVNTGLALALEKELDRLLTEDKIPYEINHFDAKKGKDIKINNPELMKLLREFAENYKKENTSRKYPYYFDKPLADFTKKELKGLNLFICRAQDENKEFDLLIVQNIENQLKAIARFTDLDNAQDYLDYLESTNM